MEASCRQLACEGERLMKNHDYEGAIEFFEAGLRAGTDQNDVLSAIYNQLGNACFYVGKYDKALEYHKKDLDIAEKIGDRQGMAKAYGNLGNTFKALKNFANAQKCCELHLDITRQLGDVLGEGRACYNLGNVHHAIGKLAMSKRTPQDIAEGRKIVLKAIEYYKTALNITVQLHDVAGEGRAVGNLGNAYTAIGEFAEAIQYHRRRLKIAQDANDLPGRARACGNLGNAYSALGDFTEAIKYYQQSLSIAKESNNPAGQAQAYYCLGSSYWLLKNGPKAIEFFELYLAAGEELKDRAIQMRAWQNLRSIYNTMGDRNKALHYHELLNAAQGTVGTPLPAVPRPGQPPTAAAASPGAPRTPTITIPQAGGKTYIPPSAAKPAEKSKAKDKKEDKGLLKGLFKSGPRVEMAMPFQPDDDDDDDDGGVMRTRKIGADKSAAPSAAAAALSASTAPASASAPAAKSDASWLNDAIKQAGEMAPSGPAARPAAADDSEDFFDMLLSAQTTRLDDQRSSAPGRGVAAAAPAGPAVSDFGLDEEFFDMLVSVQQTRFDEQRSPMPSAAPLRTNAEPQPVTPTGERKHIAPVLDDSMSFFEMLAAAKAHSQS